MFGRCGIAVTGWAGLGLDDGCDTVTRGHVRKLIPEAGRAAIGKAEAIVLSCTGWPTLDLIPDLQRESGKPVLSSNLAIG